MISSVLLVQRCTCVRIGVYFAGVAGAGEPGAECDHADQQCTEPVLWPEHAVCW